MASRHVKRKLWSDPVSATVWLFSHHVTKNYMKDANLLAEPSQSPGLWEIMTKNCCCWKPLHFGVICYAVIDTWNNVPQAGGNWDSEKLSDFPQAHIASKEQSRDFNKYQSESQTVFFPLTTDVSTTVIAASLHRRFPPSRQFSKHFMWSNSLKPDPNVTW